MTGLFLTAEEEAYRDFLSDINQPFWDRLNGIWQSAAAESGGFLGMRLAWTRAAERSQTFVASIVDELRRQSPPPSYLRLHAMELEKWSNINEVMPRYSAALRSLGAAIQREAEGTGNGQLSEGQWQRVMQRHKSRFDSAQARVQALIVTYGDLERPVIDSMNSALDMRLRSSWWYLPRGGTATDGAGALSLTGTISFEPFFVPLKVTFATDGGVTVSASGRILLPFGVISFGASVAPRRSRTLRIKHRGKQHLYSIDDEAFTFTFHQVDGTVTIAYDGAGNITVEMLDRVPVTKAS